MGKAKEITDQYRLNEWANIIKERVKSGKTINEWCKENNVSPNSYYYWLRKVKLLITQTKAPLTPQIVPLLPPFREDAQDLSKPLILKIGGITIEIQDATSDVIIERTLRIIKGLC